MDQTGEIDQDDVLRARSLLLGSGRPSLAQQVKAYRVLAEVGPLTYLPKLAEAMTSWGFAEEVRDRPDARLARHSEAAAAARRIDAGYPRRTEVLVRALSAYRFTLYAVGRRAEALAVCEEMADAGRWGFDHGQVRSPVYGHEPLAIALAEEGDHQGAARLCGRFVQADRAEGSARVSFWTVLKWTAELDAAGHHDAALEAFAASVDRRRADLDKGDTSLAILVWQLVHQAGMLAAAGHHGKAGAAREEALALLSELDRTGERRSWSNILAWWSTLYAVSGSSAEPVAIPGSPGPAFGFTVLDWSPDVRQAYVNGLPTLAAAVTDLRGAAESDPRKHLPALVAQHRRLRIRSAVERERRSHLILKPLRPLFAEGVALARRLTDLVDAPESREALAQALTDRSMFLVAAKQYGEAYDDYREVVRLLG